MTKLQNSSLYPIFFAILCVISGVSSREIYLPCIWFLTGCTVFSCLFSKDMKVILVPAFMIYYAIGFDVPDGYFTELGRVNRTPAFDPSSLPHLLACLALILIALLVRAFGSEAVRKRMRQRGLFFWGILFMDAALLCNGLFSPHWVPVNLLYGGMIALGLSVIYFVFLPLLTDSEDLASYLCKSLVCAGLVVAGQTLILIGRMYAGDLVSLSEIFFGAWTATYRHMLSLSWGLSTITGAVVATAIPAAFYLARNNRFPLLSLGAIIVLMETIILIDTRSAILVGVISCVVGIVVCVRGGKNKRINRITLGTILGVALLAVLIWLLSTENSVETLKKLSNAMRLDFLWKKDTPLNAASSGRLEIWKTAWADFLSAPLFGVGFSRISWGVWPSGNFFNWMYHNIFLEFLASMGVVGILAFLIHLKHIAEAFLRKRSADRSIILAISVVILGLSLLDNFFFYPNFALVYGAVLVCGELMLEEKRKEQLKNVRRVSAKEKPRVMFTFVEAGKGHIVPTRTVCEAFKRKYGDRAEVIESQFFSETGNTDMQKTEKLFTKAVQQQNRSPLLSILCKIGNTIAGNTFALYVLLSMTVSGRKTNPLAVAHLEESDAHVIYTAHWSIPYYVNQMKGAHPYTVCFCPDVYSNGAFDVDCNAFLISNEKGYRRVMRNRMYAGGNVTRIPFPMREEIARYRDGETKRGLREQLEIPEKEFVVVLSDGGYGMARLEKTVKHLLRLGCPMTLIALCGTNQALYERLRALPSTEGIRLIPVPFTDRVLDYVAVADLFVGKSGANSMAEPAALEIPILITKCITYIERGIKNYYVRDVGGALYIPSARGAAERIARFAEDRESLAPYRAGMKTVGQGDYDAEATADLLWQSVCEVSEIPISKKKRVKT